MLGLLFFGKIEQNMMNEVLLTDNQLVTPNFKYNGVANRYTIYLFAQKINLKLIFQKLICILKFNSCNSRR